MSTLYNDLESRKQHLEKTIEKKKLILQKAPKGRLRAFRNGKCYQYYLVDDFHPGNGRFLKKSEMKLIRALAQKEYDSKVLKACIEEKKTIDRMLRLYNSNAAAEQIYERIKDAKKPVTMPIELPDSEFKTSWQNRAYEGLPFKKDAPVFITDKEERVRSKSEMIIANTLRKMEIPYHYECPLSLDGTDVYPDFTLLRLEDRTEIYWEHFGLMDDDDYREKAMKKIELYERCGLFPGKKLIMTFETARQPINTQVIVSMIKAYL